MNILVLNTLGKEVFETFFPQDVQDKLAEVGEVHYVSLEPGEELSTEFLKLAEKTEVLFTGWGVPCLNEDFYCHAKRLKLIAHTGGSVGDLASPELEQRGILLLSGNRYYAESVAQATICYMLLGQRRLYPILKKTEKDGWCSEVTTQGLRSKTVGLVSFGMIAKNVARMLQVFDCRVKVYSSHKLSDEELRVYGIEQCSAEELFRTADIISIHSALTDKTYHEIDAEKLSLVHDDALLVNTARGSVIDEQALIKELCSGRLRAVLDVFEEEPLPMTSPLRGLDNVVIVPHMGGPTTDVRRLVTLGLIDDVKRFAQGSMDLENQISMAYAKNMTSHAVTERRKHEIQEG